MLPKGFIFLQRDWLSSNSLLLKLDGAAYLFDSGYVTHAKQLEQLLHVHLDGQTLDALFNSHLHSDHCGGNAMLQQAYPQLLINVPATQFHVVNDWHEDLLSFQMTGQLCERFTANSPICPNDILLIHDQHWQAFSAKGHDNDSLIFFEHKHGILLSADALWENGVSVVFPEFLGGDGFQEVAKTYDLIESLNVRTVIPGHGPAFSDVTSALASSRRKLEYFHKHPESHATYSAKVMLKFKLMEIQQMPYLDFTNWCANSALLHKIHSQFFTNISLTAWISSLITTLSEKQLLIVKSGLIRNL